MVCVYVWYVWYDEKHSKNLEEARKNTNSQCTYVVVSHVDRKLDAPAILSFDVAEA
mgnify:CR=1 FL=1